MDIFSKFGLRVWVVGGIIICESRRERALPEMTAPYKKRREYTYGKVKLCIYTKENA